MSVQYNFTRLKNIYFESIHSPERMMQFDVQIGRGQFLFMMFISDEDEDSRDMLFIYMRNTAVLIKLKMYGSHKQEEFKVYITPDMEKKMINELELTFGEGDFSFANFLCELNDAIPLRMNRDERRQAYRVNRNIVRNLGVIDEEDKTVLIGTMQLQNGRRPRHRTIRKLYMFVDADIEVIDRIIEQLYAHNITLRWTTEDRRRDAVALNDILWALQ